MTVAETAAPDDSEEPPEPTAEDAVAEPPSDVESETAEAAPPEHTVRATRRWYGIGTLSLLALGAGVVTGTAAPLLAGVFGLAFGAYSGLTGAPDPDLAVERRLEPEAPEPGDTVTVTVEVRNEGSWPCFDLRLVDGVPDRLGVVRGTPRHAAVLRSGASTEFSYEVRAERGDHRFAPTTVIARDLSGGTETVTTAGEATTLSTLPEFPTEPPTIPLRSKVSQFTGRFPGDTGGPGIEFHATRQYRRGDPLSRVDWRRTARTGELTTVEFRVERTVRVCLVFDVRKQAHRAPEAAAASAVERSIEGGIAAYASLTEAGHDVGIGVIGPTDCWLRPGSGDRHRTATRHLFATDPALSPTPTDAETNIYESTQRLKGRLPADAQVMLFSPLVDDRILATAIRLDAHGYAVTVMSPDVTADATTGEAYARAQRRLRIADLRGRAIPVVDWRADEELGQAIARTAERWSA